MRASASIALGEHGTSQVPTRFAHDVLFDPDRAGKASRSGHVGAAFDQTTCAPAICPIFVAQSPHPSLLAAVTVGSCSTRLRAGCGAPSESDLSATRASVAWRLAQPSCYGLEGAVERAKAQMKGVPETDGHAPTLSWQAWRGAARCAHGDFASSGVSKSYSMIVARHREGLGDALVLHGGLYDHAARQLVYHRTLNLLPRRLALGKLEPAAVL
jgi:hypothetical protein